MELGLSSDEFYAITPRQLDALARAHQRRLRREVEHREFMFAQVTAMVANTGFRGWEKPRQPLEFMPSRVLEAKRAPRINRQAVARDLRGVMAQLMAQHNAGQRSA